MNQKVNILMVTLAGIFQQVVAEEARDNTKLFLNPMWFESDGLPFFATGVQQYHINDHFGEALRIYGVSIRSRKVTYPIDVYEIIVTEDFISIRCSGIDLPICTMSGKMVITPDQFTRVIHVSIESNSDLMDALKAQSGGPNEIKSFGK